MRRLAAATILALLLAQQACGKEPADSRATDTTRPAPARLSERDDSRPQPAMGAAGGDCSRDLAAALDGAIAETLGAVRSNDPDALLNQIDSGGLDINGTVSRDGLARQFAGRTGRYCDLFSCGGKEGGMHHMFHAGPADKQVDAANGRASVFLNANTNDELDLSYKWASCKWWLTAIATP